MQSGRHLVILGIAALIAVAMAFFVVGQNDQSAKQTDTGLVLPDLAGMMDQVAAIHVSKAGSGYSLSKQDSGWQMDSYDGFPADETSLRRLLAGLARMTKLEKKTGNPDRHDKLALRDPAMDSAASTGLRLEDQNGKILAHIITGKIIRPAEGSKPARFYLRQADDDQAWLVEAIAALPEEEKDWINLDAAKLDRDRTKIARLKYADGEIVEVSRAVKTDSDFTLQNIPEGYQAKSEYIANSLGSAISWPSLERPARLSGTAEILSNGHFESFDGLILESQTLRLEDGSHALTLSARVTDIADEKVKAEAASVNALTTGWMFRVPDHKIEDFTRRMDYFIKKESEAAQESE